MSTKKNEEHFLKHFENCDIIKKINSGELIENKDFVICKICNFHGQNIGIHLKKIHNIDARVYCKQYNCKTTSEISAEIYRIERSKKFDGYGDYYSYCKVNNIDLTEYKKKCGETNSKLIMSNIEERKKRSERMSRLVEKQNNDPNIIRIRSETAKRTSSRPEIQKERSDRLKKWRDNNPEEFYEKCIKKMIKSYNSRPEQKLFQFLKEIIEFNFKRNQFVISKNFITKSKKKQVDFGDKNKRIYIEYDGVLHFSKKIKKQDLELTQKKDKLLDEHILKHKWVLIRISYDQYVNKNNLEKSFFKQECLDKIIEILNNPSPGIYRIGKAYSEI